MTAAGRRMTPFDLARIEEAGLNALQTQRQLFYDGWLLRLSPGVAKRGRSVNAHFGSSLPLAGKLAYCENVYAQHALPTLFRITPFVQPTDLEAALEARGYESFGETLVQAVALDRPPALPVMPMRSWWRRPTRLPSSTPWAICAVRRRSSGRRIASAC